VLWIPLWRINIHKSYNIDNNINKQPWLVSKCYCSSQKPLLTTVIWTRDLWFRSPELRPLDQSAVKYRFRMKNALRCVPFCAPALGRVQTSILYARKRLVVQRTLKKPGLAYTGLFRHVYPTGSGERKGISGHSCYFAYDNKPYFTRRHVLLKTNERAYKRLVWKSSFNNFLWYMAILYE
jgi:hypothetical protein